MAAGPRQRTADGGGPHPTLLDCLTFVARVHGRDTALADALAGAKQTAAAPHSAALLGLARKAGLRGRRVRLRWADLPRLARHLPAIVPLTDGSHVILTALREDAGTLFAVMEDPRGGAAEPVAIDRVRFERVWTGTLLLVRAGQRARGAARPFGWRAITGVVLQEPRLLRDALAATLALAALAAVPILFVQLLLLRVLPYKADHSLLLLSIGLGVAMAIEAAFGALRGYFVSRLAARTQARLTARLFDRLLGLPVDAVQSLPVGESRHAFGGLRTVETALTTLLPAIALDAGVLVVLLPLLAYLDVTLAAIVVVLGSLAAALLVGALPRLRRAGERSAAAQAAREAFLVQSLAGMAAVKALSLVPDRVRQWDRLTALVGKTQLDEARVGDRIAALALPAERVLVVGMLALGIGLTALRAEPAQVAPLIAFTLLVQRLLAPLPALAGMARAQGAARAAVRRLGALVNQPAEWGAASHGSAAVTRGAITVDRVRFRYPGAASLALRGVSFTVEPGTTLGIMGKSGAGKTTIARLLQRLQTAQEGSIRIDGVALADFDPQRLRRAVAVVPQTSMLFAGTIRDTITAAKPDASFEEMTLAAHRAGADEFIDRLPRGYETRLDEGAPALSGGQRQRLALARALITAPRVLILDEALSALDAEIEATVEGRLREARQGLTTIIISHRLSALMACDTILVMADGEVRDIGRHADLLERCDLYGAAWTRQQGAIEGDAPLGDGLLALS